MNEKETNDLLQDTEEEAAEFAVWIIQAIMARVREQRVPHIAMVTAAAAAAAALEKAMVQIAEAHPRTAVNGARIARQAITYGLDLGRQRLDIEVQPDSGEEPS